MYNKRSIGAVYEDSAVKFLLENGYVIVERNFFCNLGEVDIIAKDGKYLVFVEVKYRKDDKKGFPEDAIGYYKQRKIIKVAMYYLMRKGLSTETPIRFDAVTIFGNDIKIIKNAFEL